jgi:hypothetical protein
MLEKNYFYFHTTLHGGNTIVRPTTTATIHQHEMQQHLK